MYTVKQEREGWKNVRLDRADSQTEYADGGLSSQC
jgi:hypothetical protein